MSKRIAQLRIRGEQFGFSADLSIYHCAKIIEYIATLPPEDVVFRNPRPLPEHDKKGRFVSASPEEKK